VEFLEDSGLPAVLTPHDAELVCPISTMVLPDGSKCDGGIKLRCQGTGCEVGHGLAYRMYLDRMTRRRLMPRVKTIVAPSHALKRALQSNGFGSNIVVNHPFIDPIPRRSLRMALGPGLTVGFLGRLESYKGLEVLLRACRMYLARHGENSLRLDVAGQGPLPMPSESWITLRGQLRGQELEDWWDGIEVLAVPSQGWENFGLVAAEGVLRGILTLVSDVGGLPETVPPEWVIKNFSEPEAWADAFDERWAGCVEVSNRAREQLLPEISVERHLGVLNEVYAGVVS
jgi:glycosyltransferase involved in cell wall biosynthesis